MGRLALRAAWDKPELEVVAINEPSAGPHELAHLLTFDSVQGRWGHQAHGTEGSKGRGYLEADQRRITTTQERNPADLPWRELGVELVIEASGAFRTRATLDRHLSAGASRVLVSCPVKDGPPNIVVGVNHLAYDLAKEPIVTAASCTTNCLAPVVRTLHDSVGIDRGLVTTIHNPTNTQVVTDAFHSDLRRARASQINLIPTSTNSATAVTMIIPELAGKLDSIAVRAPVLNASLTDCVFSMSRNTDIEEVNSCLRAAASSGPLHGILGYEDRPLVSSDYVGDPRSGIVDALSTRVTDHQLVKVMVWYDNEWGYANRLAELAVLMSEAT